MACVKSDFHASHHWLEENKRLHLQHGPIDLVIQADGDERECALAFDQAIACFETVLVSIVNELAVLRTPIANLDGVRFSCVVAQQMVEAVRPYADRFVTPMAAVAGSVAQYTLAQMCLNRKLTRVAVNNGGDIALHLSAHESYMVGICESPNSSAQNAHAQIHANSPVRGIATSGWQGRSHSLGIADAVTVLASNASRADVAATLIANQIDLPGSAKVERVAASALSSDSDLGDQLVTTQVHPLTLTEKQQALQAAVRFAQTLVHNGLINSAILTVQGERHIVGHNPSIQWRQSA